MSFNETEAIVEYGDGALTLLGMVLIICSVTKKEYHSPELKYWSVERQEPYLDAETSFVKEEEINLD